MIWFYGPDLPCSGGCGKPIGEKSIRIGNVVTCSKECHDTEKAKELHEKYDGYDA